MAGASRRFTFPSLGLCSNLFALQLIFSHVSCTLQRFDGVSLRPLLKNASAQAKGYAISQWARRLSCTKSFNCMDGSGDPAAKDPDASVMSYSMRTDQWRYTVWVGYNWDTVSDGSWGECACSGVTACCASSCFLPRPLTLLNFDCPMRP